MKIRRAPRRLITLAIVGSMLVVACTSTASEPRSVTSLPVNEPVATAASSEPTPDVYVVVRGDTMVSIARAHDMTLAELLRLNDVPNPQVIEPGLELLLSPLPEPPPPLTAVATEPIIPVDEAWYQRWADRLPQLPEQFESAQPVLLALGAVAVAMVGVGIIAIVIPLIYAIVGAGASGMAFSSGRLQAAAAGLPLGSRPDGETRRLLRRSFGWRPRLQISRSSLTLRRSRPDESPLPEPTPPPAIPTMHAEPTTSTADASSTLPEPPPTAYAPSAISTAYASPTLPAPPSTAIAPTRVSAPRSLDAAPRPAAPSTSWWQRDAVATPTRPVLAPPAVAQEPEQASRIARWASVTGAAVSTATARTQSTAVAGARGVARWTRVAAAATAHATMTVLRSSARLIVRASRSVVAVPGRFLHQREDQRRRKEFRERVESSSAARMRLGLREDTEGRLEQSLEESLGEGWLLEAAWCLQLLAEEADLRGDRALAEKRRVRARSLIREHADAEEPQS